MAFRGGPAGSMLQLRLGSRRVVPATPDAMWIFVSMQGGGAIIHQGNLAVPLLGIFFTRQLADINWEYGTVPTLPKPGVTGSRPVGDATPDYAAVRPRCGIPAG